MSEFEGKRDILDPTWWKRGGNEEVTGLHLNFNVIFFITFDAASQTFTLKVLIFNSQLFGCNDFESVRSTLSSNMEMYY